MKVFARFAVLFCLLVPLVAQDLSDENLEGQIVWPKEYRIDIYRPQLVGEESKSYLVGVMQNLVADSLTLQRSAVTLGKVKPLSLEYPMQKNTDKATHTNREDLLKRFPAPQVLPLKIERLPSNGISPEACTGLADGRYAILSTLRLKGTKVEVQMKLCQGSTQVLDGRSVIDEQDLVSAVTRLTNPVRAKLTGDNFASLKLESAPTQTSVYLDAQFLGKTPLHYSYLIPGKYQLTLKRVGFHDAVETIKTKAGETFTKKISLVAAEEKGRLEITTQPPGAKIYLDADYLGVSPKIVPRVAFGTYRLHLFHKDSGEVYRTITLDEKHTSLKIGETLSEFIDNYKPGFWGLTYKSWYWVSLSTAAAFMGAGIGTYIWRDNAQEEIYARLSAKTPSAYTAEDQAFLAEKNAQYKTRGDYAMGFMVGAGAFALLSLYFYVQHLLSADEGIVRANPPKEPGVEIQVGLMPGQSSVEASFRF